MSKESVAKKREQRRARRQRQAERREAQAAVAESAERQLAEQAAALAKAQSRVIDLEHMLGEARSEAGYQARCAELAGLQVDALASSNVELERQLRAAEARAADRDRLARELADLRSEDRDVAKLRRRLQESHARVTSLQVELDRTKARIPPAPLVYGASPEKSTAASS